LKTLLSKNSQLLLPVALLLYCAVVGFGWVGQTPSFEELAGGVGRLQEVLSGGVGRFIWWSPSYMMGATTTPLLAGLLPIVIAGSLIATFGFFSAGTLLKLFGLAMIFFGGLAMGRLAEKLLGDRWVSVVCGLLYAMSAQFVLRLAQLEHLSSALCMVFGPLIFLAMLRCEERGGWRSALLLALSVSAMILSYVKLFLLFLPAGAIFFAWRMLGANPTHRRNLVVGCLRGALLSVPLALLPLLPMLREGKWLALFELQPFEAWQVTYSFYSAISWLDWGNLFTHGSALGALSPTRHAPLEFYLGFVVVFGIFVAAGVGQFRAPWWATKPWKVLRVFTLMMLVGTMLACGPKSIFFSHMMFLEAAGGMRDFTIALVWAMFLSQGVLIYWLWAGVSGRVFFAAASMLVYYFFPVFRFLEYLPLFSDIRAPSAVWTAFGSLSAVLAAGAGLWLIWGGLSQSWKRVGLLVVIIGLAAFDFAFLYKPFFREGLPASLWTNYQEAQKFLATAPRVGRVAPYSGRYFYLTTPADSGRGLTTEALMRHTQLRWIRYMEAGAPASELSNQAFQDLFGVAYLLLDLSDPDFPKEAQEKLKKTFPKVFENADFMILENPTCLAPAFIGRQVMRAAPDSFLNPVPLLLLGSRGYLSAELAGEGAVGTVDEKGAETYVERTGGREQGKVTRLQLQDARNKDPQRFVVTGLTPENTPGLLVVPESWHPDWVAFQDGKPLRVLRSVGALIGVQTRSTGDVSFEFSPPWWYSATFGLCLLSWVIALATFPLMRLAPARWRGAWVGTLQGAQPRRLEISRSAISRSLVIIPTYNEAAGIVAVIDRTLECAAQVEILIVDDGSPDGTAGLVRGHREIGKRVHLLARESKRGLGNAYRAGFDWAREQGFDCVIEMDADLSHDPADIPRLLAAIDGGMDLAIGSRYIGGVRVINWPEHRLILSAFASRYVKILTGLPLTDATSGFKAVRVAALEVLPPEALRAQGYGFQIELHHALWKAGACMVEVPIIFTERRDGVTKMNVAIAFEAAWRTVQLAIGR